MKVYLQYAWKYPDSPYYKYLVENPPENIKYLNVENQSGAITNKKNFLLLNLAKRTARGLLHTANIPILNTKVTKVNKTTEEYDLIHCAHCMSLNETPWVADFESWWQFWLSGEVKKKKLKEIKRILLSKSCKKIMPWSERIKQDILEFMPEIKDKVEVVYPAVPPAPISVKKKKKAGKITILYASRYFYIKGGLIALETLRNVKLSYPDVDVIFISDVPDKIKKQYPEINIQDIVPYDKMLEYYKTVDIFFYPSLLDTFGFSLLESMSYGLPIVTLNTGGTTNCREIVEDGKTGLVLDVPSYKDNQIYKKSRRLGKVEMGVVNRLGGMLGYLIENKKVRETMAKNCREVIKNGKFSIQERNKKLKRIYEEAIANEK